ncbi:MAG: hypothetical protein ACPGVO_19810, partial [Spirulinaceae cyanobacterium]
MVAKIDENQAQFHHSNSYTDATHHLDIVHHLRSVHYGHTLLLCNRACVGASVAPLRDNPRNATNCWGGLHPIRVNLSVKPFIHKASIAAHTRPTPVIATRDRPSQE